jgi:hypothetical protein
MNDYSPSNKEVKANIIAANTAGVRAANAGGRMEFHKIVDHKIIVVSKNGLGQRTSGQYDIPRVPSLKMIKELRSQHSGSNRIYYVSAVVSTCGAKLEGAPMVNLKTGREE